MALQVEKKGNSAVISAAFNSMAIGLAGQALEAQMLPATAPFYMGLASGWAILMSPYIQHTGADLALAMRYVCKPRG